MVSGVVVGIGFFCGAVAGADGLSYEIGSEQQWRENTAKSEGMTG